MTIKYIGKTISFALTHNKTYEVISIEKKWYRILDDTGEDYLYPPENFEIIENSVLVISIFYRLTKVGRYFYTQNQKGRILWHLTGIQYGSCGELRVILRTSELTFRR